MKSSLIVYAFLLFSAFLSNSCTNKTEAEKEKIYQKAREKVKYQCPNQCEGDKYCEEQLMCPKCNEGMEIVVTAKKE